MKFFGYKEQVLRFIPLVLSIGAVILFYLLASQYSMSWATPLATGLFAVSDRLIFYSADMHPYSTEVFFVILVLWMFNRLESKGFLFRDAMCFVFTTVISVWFSFTVVFVLGGIALTSISGAIFKKQWENFHKLIMIHSCWVISFSSVYVYNIHGIMQAGVTYSIWAESFIKGHQGALSTVKWVFKDFWDMFRDPLRIISPTGGFLLFLAGAMHSFVVNKKQFFLLLSPFILTLGAALLKQYPFEGRVILFLMPFLLILISLGVEAAAGWFKGKMKMLWLIPACSVLLIFPLRQTMECFAYGWEGEGGREAVYYLKNNMLTQDIVLMSTESRFVYIYYMEYIYKDMKNRWLGRIGDSLIKGSGSPPQAEYRFEHLKSDAKGHIVGVSFVNDTTYGISSGRWVKVKYKREWLLLISPSEELRKLLERSLHSEQKVFKEAKFNDAYLYLLEKQ
jgi:hypothetical protein